MAQRPHLIVRRYETNVLSYIWRCIRNARFLLPLASRFLLMLRRQTILGWWWVFIRALLPTLGIIAILQHVPSLNPGTLPYGLYVISGMVLWTSVSNGLTFGTRSLRVTKRIHFKIALPKLMFVVASLVIPAFFMTVFIGVLLIFLLYSYLSEGTSYLVLDWQILLFPLPILLSFMLVTGLTTFTSVMFLFARDARLVLGLITQFWFYVTPVIYGIEILPETWQFAVLYLNPMASLIEFFRWCLFGTGLWTVTSLTFAIGISIGLLLLGARFQMRSEWVVREVV